MKFQRPSYPYILFLAALFILAAIRTPDQGTNQITVGPANNSVATDAHAQHVLISANLNE